MIINPVAIYHGHIPTKFGLPRQSGLADDLCGRIVLVPEYRHGEALRGLEGFDYIWLIWEFSANDEGKGLTVRPPRLGGNERIGVFASRSPFRPNRLGLSCVKLDSIEMTTNEGPVINVRGADLMDGTPIYDIKPYVAYADAHPEARSGFVDSRQWQPLTVVIPDSISAIFSPDEQQALRQVLSQDPRPHYHDSPERIYGMPFAGYDVKFMVDGNTLQVIDTQLLTINTSKDASNPL